MMEDKDIIGLFFSRSEKAIEEITRKYGKLCRKISFGILHNEEDVEECVNSSLEMLWNTIPPKKPESLSGYLCMTVRNISLNVYRREKRRGRDYYEELSEIIPDRNSVEETYDCKQTTQLINRFLVNTNKKNRQVFTARYYFGMSVKDIAENLGMSESSVKTRLSRVRNELRTYLSERGVEV